MSLPEMNRSGEDKKVEDIIKDIAPEKWRRVCLYQDIRKAYGLELGNEDPDKMKSCRATQKITNG